jgi:hypothetical protein
VTPYSDLISHALTLSYESNLISAKIALLCAKIVLDLKCLILFLCIRKFIDYAF